MSTPFRVPEAEREQNVPEWLVAMPIVVGHHMPQFFRFLVPRPGSPFWQTNEAAGGFFNALDLADIGVMQYARMATRAEINAHLKGDCA